MDSDAGGIVALIAFLVFISFIIAIVGLVIGVLLVVLYTLGIYYLITRLTLFLISLRLNAYISDISKISQIISLRFVEFELIGTAKKNVKEKFFDLPLHISLIVNCIILVATFILLFNGTPLIEKEKDWEIVLKIALVISFITMFIAHYAGRKNYYSRAQGLIDGAIDKIKTYSFSNNLYKKLSKIIEQIVVLSQELEIDFQLNYLETIKEALETNKDDVLNNEVAMQSLFITEVQNAEHDLQNLRVAKRSFLESIESYDELFPIVISTNSLSLIKKMDALYQNLLEAREYFLSQKKWELFSETIYFFKNDLEDLRVVSKNYSPGAYDNGDHYDPYAILGVSREMTDKEIQRFYHKLAQLYHPDKKEVRDDKKFKEISNAYEAIMSLRKTGTHNG